MTIPMTDSKRDDGRTDGQVRPITISLDPQPFAEGSALIRWGRTEVLCAVSVGEKVPDWLQGRGRGWLTAQYAMLPRATKTRNQRAGYDGRVKGRSTEIQRLIGRSLRAGLDLDLLGERVLNVDCDVIVADGGTRCASITGAWVAVRRALAGLKDNGLLPGDPVLPSGSVWAVSAGLVDGRPLLDLEAAEDQRAEADFNFVLTGPERIIEIQGTGERRGFSWSEVQALHRLCRSAADKIISTQETALEGGGEGRS